MIRTNSNALTRAPKAAIQPEAMRAVMVRLAHQGRWSAPQPKWRERWSAIGGLRLPIQGNWDDLKAACEFKSRQSVCGSGPQAMS
ncbi:MAG: hypothetical protein JNM56_10195 [Planctomycetia bacterium]|nr:hypothetical protein [Planctomycetia bacterium]